MLRSTGLFRGLDCPFYSGSGDGCNRPYCHFRHSNSRQRAGQSSAVYQLEKASKGPADSNDQGYDPFNPEVVRPGERYNAKISSSPVLDPSPTELELVNQAIEAVQSEMEKEKKKLSRIGDQGYDPANSAINASYGSQAAAATLSTHSAYDPGSYQISHTSEYNPTPCAKKYTLDSERNNSSSSTNSMEYIPTAVCRVVAKKAGTTLMSRSSSTTSSFHKNKYTLDNSKPITDMEYDPLSNFSAKPGANGAKEQGEKKDRNKRGLPKWQKQSTDEEYVPVVKKQRLVKEPQKYMAEFEFGEESSGNEYRPMPVRHLQARKSSVESMEDGNIKCRKSLIDDYVDCESESFEIYEDNWPAKLQNKKSIKNSVQAKTVLRDTVLKKDITESIKKSSSREDKKRSSGVEKAPQKPCHDCGRKEKSSKVGDGKVKSKVSEKEIKSKDGKHKKPPDTKKGKQSHRDREVKKAKLDKAKYKEPKNGRMDNSRREKNKNKSSSQEKHISVLTQERKDIKAAKAKLRSLSHVELFGDESPGEEEAEDEEDERVVRKSASAFKRISMQASDSTSTSSEDEKGPRDEHNGHSDENDCGDEGFSTLHGDVEYDSDPMEECLRIFNESKYVKTEDKGRQAKQLPGEKDEDNDSHSTLALLFPGQKKRLSHFKAKGSVETSLNILPKPQRRLTAQEVCYQRMQIAQQQAAQLATSGKIAASGEKRRVIHCPNPALASTKKPVLSDSRHGVLSMSKNVPDQSSVKAHTSSAMLSKTVSTAMQKRVAHTPTLKSVSVKRPVIPTEFGAKVSTNVRQRYLNIFIDECLKFCTGEEAAFQMALDEEKLVYERSSSKNIYLNVAVNAVKKLRSKSTNSAATMPTAATKKSSMSINRKSQSHEEVLGGRLAATTSYTVNRTGKSQDVQLQGAVLYQKLKPYILSEELLQEHGYPRPHPERRGHAIVYNAPEKQNQDPFSKVCCRCGAEYRINANGNCVRKEECNHHWGRLRRYKVSGGWETQYNCCLGSVGSPGCQVTKQHVQDNRKESLDGYVKTFSKRLPSDENAGVYALDCEMCYTKQGLELTRVTVINSELKVVYDTFVKPESKVVDYNTRFSGVTEEDLETASMRLRDVQAVLLNMFSADTILIGHSLESDLFALKLLHSTIVDTAVVFPHGLGLPYKRALRNIVADHLKRIIQNNAEGHDSSEDATACMELMIWKIRDDAKAKR